jgi:serine/threonine protein kinase
MIEFIGGASKGTINGNIVTKTYTIHENDVSNIKSCITNELFILNLLDGHKGFPKILDVVIDPPNYSIVMPYLGKCLSQVSEPLDIFRKILYNVSILHQHNIVHVDLKPNNIVIDDQQNVSIIDFSASCIMTKRDEGELHVFGPATGHYDYMAPETYNKFADPWDRTTRLDIWSLGCILYEMITGFSLMSGYTITVPLIGGQNCDQITGYFEKIMEIHKHMDQIYQKVDAIVDHDLEKKMIKMMLQTNPLDRPTTIELLKMTGSPMCEIPTLYNVVSPKNYKIDSGRLRRYPMTIQMCGFVDRLMDHIMNQDPKCDVHSTYLTVQDMILSVFLNAQDHAINTEKYMILFVHMIKKYKMSVIYLLP